MPEAPQKCTHRGCEKLFTDPDEPCYHHPGAPIFHEGQKGWQCCKTRVLTFEEFLEIPPCTQGKHSTTAPVLAPAQTSGPGSQKHPEVPPPPGAYGTPLPASKPLPQVTSTTPKPQPKPERPLEQDPPDAVLTPGLPCKRTACKAKYAESLQRSDDECVFHPNAPIFHEGSKGYLCCKRRVLEFEEFLKIPGCQRSRHLFVGQPKDAEEERLENCRNDFYQTFDQVIVSIFAKKVDKDNAKIVFEPTTLKVDLPMDGPQKKRFKMEYPLYAGISPEECTYKIMGTKVELRLKKADATSWPTLRNDEVTGEIIQIGKPATA